MPSVAFIPSDPGLAFLNDLIEDYADEWLTKAMFHYRWSYADDIAKASTILPLWRGYSIPSDAAVARAKSVGERQIGRLYVVGSNPVTAPVIEASYARFLAAFEAHLEPLSVRARAQGRRRATSRSSASSPSSRCSIRRLRR